MYPKLEEEVKFFKKVCRKVVVRLRSSDRENKKWSSKFRFHFWVGYVWQGGNSRRNSTMFILLLKRRRIRLEFNWKCSRIWLLTRVSNQRDVDEKPTCRTAKCQSRSGSSGCIRIFPRPQKTRASAPFLPPRLIYRQLATKCTYLHFTPMPFSRTFTEHESAFMRLVKRPFPRYQLVIQPEHKNIISRGYKQYAKK